MSGVESFLYLDHTQWLDGNWTHSWFDVGRQQMLLFRDGIFYFWTPSITQPSQPVKYYSIGKQISILLAKVSVDSKLIVLQINKFVLLIIDISTHKKWEIMIKALEGNEILPNGLVWSDHGGNSQDLVIITTRGLELYKISCGRGQCKLSRSITHKINFFWYEPNFRAILLGSVSPQHSHIEMTGYFLRFDIADIPRLELPPPDKMPTFTLANVEPDDVKLITLYGSLFCATHETSSDTDTLSLYALSKTKVVRSYVFPLYVSSDIKLSVLDNLLCCHCLQSQMSFIFDIMLVGPVNTTVAVNPESSTDAVCACGTCTLVVDDKKLQRYSEAEPASSSYPQTTSSAGNADTVISADENLKTDEEASNGASKEKAVEAEWIDAVGGGGDGGGLYGFVGFGDNTMQSSDNDASGLGMGGGGGSAGRGDGFKIDSDASPDNASLSLSSLRHVRETYAGTWQLLSPDWVWDPVSRAILKLKCNMSAVVSSIHDPLRAMSFLCRRGQEVVAPKPAYLVDKAVSLKAKKLLIQSFKGWLQDPLVLLRIDYLFDCCAKNYALEFHRKKAIQGRQLQLGLRSGHDDSSEVSVEDSIGGDTASLTQEDSVSAQSSTSSSVSSQAPRTQWGIFGRKKPETDNSNSSRGVPNDSSGSSAQSGGADSAQAKMNKRISANFMRGSKNVDDELARNNRETLLSSPIIDSLEPPLAVHMYLPDLALLGGQLKGMKTMSSSSSNNTKRLNLTSSISPQASGSSGLPKTPLTTRRNAEGNLIITQIEMLCYLWLPLIDLENIRGGPEEDAYVWALSAYIGAFRRHDIAVESAISLLHINLLALKYQYSEIGRLIQLQFYSDTSEVALSALDLHDSLLYSTHVQEEGGDSDSTQVTQSQSTRKSVFVPDGLCPAGIAHIVETLKQAGLDMLWRQKDRVAVVRWLLEHNEVLDAISLCMKRNGKWRNDLTPVSLPGIDFFRSAIAQLSKINIFSEASPNKWSEGRKVELLFTVYKFLADWDTTLITVQKV